MPSITLRVVVIVSRRARRTACGRCRESVQLSSRTRAFGSCSWLALPFQSVFIFLISDFFVYTLSSLASLRLQPSSPKLEALSRINLSSTWRMSLLPSCHCTSRARSLPRLDRLTRLKQVDLLFIYFCLSFVSKFTSCGSCKTFYFVCYEHLFDRKRAHCPGLHLVLRHSLLYSCNACPVVPYCMSACGPLRMCYVPQILYSCSSSC